MKKLKPIETGFTIVELMIATVMFSVIMLIITFGILSFTKAYYKGINSSAAQNTARSIVDSVSQSIQFGKKNITPTISGGGVFCADGTIYSYVPGVQYDGAVNGDGSVDAANPGLYVAPQIGDTCPFTVTGGHELLAAHTRIADLQLTSLNAANESYKVSLTLVSATGGDPANEGADLLVGGITVGPDVRCTGANGTEYCVVAKLETVVIRRTELP